MSETRAFQPRRSFIFAPGIRPEMFPKALASGADIVCIDLEDAIAPRQKAEARAKTLALFQASQADDGVERIVRINCTRTRDGLADLLAILDAATPPPAIMLPKVKSPDEVRGLDELFAEHGLATRFHVIVETNRALEAAQEIARASPRIDALFFGGVDMAADLRVGGDWESLVYARARLAHAAATAGLDVIDVPYLDLADMDGMRAEAMAAANLGFGGKGAIHPKQIPILNEVFAPSPAAVAHARRVIEAFEEGDTGLVVLDGKLIEKPVLRSMHRLVAVADAIAARAKG
jgi:citrate lyase beta subunit